MISELRKIDTSTLNYSNYDIEKIKIVVLTFYNNDNYCDYFPQFVILGSSSIIYFEIKNYFLRYQIILNYYF